MGPDRKQASHINNKRNCATASGMPANGGRLQKDKSNPRHDGPFIKIVWSTPTSMLAFLTIGILFALAHHLYYSSLNDTPVRSASQQAWSIRIGTGLAFATKTAFGAAVLVAFTQHLWTSLRNRSMSLRSIDNMFALAADPIAFMDLKVLASAKTLTLLALVSWYLPLIATVTPATLSVRTFMTVNTTHMAVPSLDFASTNDVSWGLGADAVGFGGPLPLISRLMSATASSVTILPMTAPFPNASWSLGFHAPAFRCESLESAISRNQGMTFDIGTLVNASGTTVTASFTSSTLSTSTFPSNSSSTSETSSLAFAEGAAASSSDSVLAFASGLASSPTSSASSSSVLAFASGLTTSQTSLTTSTLAVSNATTDLFARGAATTSASGSISTPSASAVPNPTTASGLPTGTFEDIWNLAVAQYISSFSIWVASAPEQLQNYLLVNIGGMEGQTGQPGGTNISCQLQNVSYEVDFSFSNGQQSTSIRDTTYLKTPAWSLGNFSGGSVPEMMPYQAYSTAFLGSLTGIVSMGATGDLFLLPATTAASANSLSLNSGATDVLRTGLAACADFRNSTLFSDSKLSSTSILPSYLCRNGTVARALEDLSHNLTMTLFTSAVLAPTRHTTTVPVTFTYPLNYYVYNAFDLWLTYGIGLGATLLCMALGLRAYWINGYSASTSFSSVLLTTRNRDLDELARGHEIGAQPPARELREARLRFGLLCERDGTAHAAFGLEGTTKVLKKGDRI